MYNMYVLASEPQSKHSATCNITSPSLQPVKALEIARERKSGVREMDHRELLVVLKVSRSEARVSGCLRYV